MWSLADDSPTPTSVSLDRLEEQGLTGKESASLAEAPFHAIIPCVFPLSYAVSLSGGRKCHDLQESRAFLLLALVVGSPFLVPTLSGLCVEEKSLCIFEKGRGISAPASRNNIYFFSVRKQYLTVNRTPSWFPLPDLLGENHFWSGEGTYQPGPFSIARFGVKKCKAWVTFFCWVKIIRYPDDLFHLVLGSLIRYSSFHLFAFSLHCLKLLHEFIVVCSWKEQKKTGLCHHLVRIGNLNSKSFGNYIKLGGYHHNSIQTSSIIIKILWYFTFEISFLFQS